MNDYIIRATAANDQIRAFAAVTTEMVETAREHHNTSPVATAALGRLLTAGAMMGSMMKGEKDVLTLQIKAGGPLQGITVTADSQGNVKGYVGNPDVCIPANSKGKLDVAGAVGPGFLTVIKDMGLKEPYSGQVMLQTCEIAEDLTYYFATSEQIPTVCALGVLINKEDGEVMLAGGLLIQLLPGAFEDTIEKLEKNLETLEPVTTMLAKGMSILDICKTALAGFEVEVLDEYPVKYVCTCSREKLERLFCTMSDDEIRAMPDENGRVVANCHFCNKKYIFNKEDLEKIIKEKNSKDNTSKDKKSKE